MARKRKNKLKKQEDFYIGLPRWLFQSKILSRNEKFVCLVLADHRNSKTKRCDPSMPLISQETGLTDRTIKKIRMRMRQLGLIIHSPGKGGKNRAKYKLNWLDGSNDEIMRLKKIFISYQPVQKRPRLTSETISPVTSETISPVTSEKEQGEQRKKLTTREKNNNREQPAVVSPLSGETNLKPSNQELENFSLAYINKVFIDTGWETFDLRAKEKVVQGAIIKANKRTKIDLEDYLRYWKKYIDKKNPTNKVGYLLAVVGKGIEAPRNTKGTTPPCLEGLDDMEDIA